MRVRRGVSVAEHNKEVFKADHMDILGIERGLHIAHYCWNLYGEHSEHEGKAPSALLVEGETQAQVIEWIFSA